MIILFDSISIELYTWTLWNTSRLVETSRFLRLSRNWTKCYAILHHLEQSHSSLVLSVGEYRDSDKIAARRKYRLCSETQSKSWKNTFPMSLFSSLCGVSCSINSRNNGRLCDWPRISIKERRTRETNWKRRLQPSFWESCVEELGFQGLGVNVSPKMFDCLLQQEQRWAL